MDAKKRSMSVLYPPLWVLLILTVLSAAALVVVFWDGWEDTPLAYVVYALSFYTLLVDVLFCIKVLPGCYRHARNRFYANPLGHRYVTDAAFRTRISLWTALTVNLLYVAVNGISYVAYRSAWYVVLAAYYGILAVMRYLLLWYVHRVGIGRNHLGELRRTVLCSFLLLTVNFALSGAVLMILYQGRGRETHGLLIYVMALYTFYTTTHAVISLIRYRKYKSPIITFTKVIALSAALVSMLSLETAMLSEFGGELSATEEWWMIAMTGAGVSLAVITMSVYIIVRSLSEIKKRKEHQSGE